MLNYRLALLYLATSLIPACGGSDGTEADKLGVAASCTATSDCAMVNIDDTTVQLSCLEQFKGGYCAIEGCTNNLDCPDGSICVTHEDQKNYCFRSCTDKSECNQNRPPESEANCSSSFDYATASDDVSGVKACIPPSN